jgi:hypothetical protein
MEPYNNPHPTVIWESVDADPVHANALTPAIQSTVFQATILVVINLADLNAQ